MSTNHLNHLTLTAQPKANLSATAERPSEEPDRFNELEDDEEPPDNATGNYNKVVQWVPVRLTFQPNADPQHKLRAGLSVEVTVDATH